MGDGRPANEDVADVLDRVADLLQVQGANEFRIRSYRNAAQTVRELEEPVAQILDERGTDALKELRDIGSALAGSIEETARTGRLGLLQRLESEVNPQQALAQVPGIGETLARRIHEQLGVSSLEELERVAHDGRLREVEGIGEERLQGVKDALAGILGRAARRRARQRTEAGTDGGQPPVDLLLEIDAYYRRKAEKGELRRIAPRRFNPDNERWLPIMETTRRGWEFTALYSNTKRAHDLGKTRDWVVIYYSDDEHESQCTVVTATSGPLKGKRIVRGRERECRSYYGVQS